MGTAIFGLVLLGLIPIAAYLLADHFPQQATRQTEYAGIRLGSSPEEVIYIKGYPPTVLAEDTNSQWKDSLLNIETAKLPQGKSVNDYRYWVWGTDRNSYILVEFTNLQVASIQCYSADKLSRCPPIAGVRDGTSERDAISKLGSKSEQKFQGPAKSISYPELGIRLHLTQEQVYMLQVSSTKATGLLVPNPPETKKH